MVCFVIGEDGRAQQCTANYAHHWNHPNYVPPPPQQHLPREPDVSEGASTILTFNRIGAAANRWDAQHYPLPSVWSAKAIPPHAWTKERNMQSARGYEYMFASDYEVNMANLEDYIVGDNTTSRYFMLFRRTKEFIKKVEELVSVVRKVEGLGLRTATKEKDRIGKWSEVSTLLVEYSLRIFEADKMGVHRFLPSQRASLYWMLDDALLRILVDGWEDSTVDIPWDSLIEPIVRSLGQGTGSAETWTDKNVLKINIPNPDSWTVELSGGTYFVKSRQFVEESLGVFIIRRTVDECVKRRLPTELEEVIVEDLMKYHDLPMGRLRTKYFPKGKAKDTVI